MPMVGPCSVYGLGLQVNTPIAGLAGLPAHPQLDVRMSLGSMPPFITAIPADRWCEYYASDELDEHGQPSIRVRRSLCGEYFRISYLDGTVIVVDAQGSRVWATWADTATVEDAAIYLLGPTLGFVLRLRGITCLHASAIAIDGRAVALVGPSGSGKSTTAAAFAGFGRSVLTDDVLALDDRDDHFKAQPAYPRVRLWPETVESLFGAAGALPRITPTWEKCFLDLNGPQYRFQDKPLPLAAVYFLADRSGTPIVPRIEAVGARDGLMSLVANTYSTYLLDKTMRAREFQVLSRLAEQVPLRRVIPSEDFGRVSGLCELITDDFRQLTSCAAT